MSDSTDLMNPTAASAALADLSHMLDAATTLMEVNSIQQRAEALRRVLEVARADAVWQNRFCAQRLLSMLRMGEMLAAADMHKGGRPTHKPLAEEQGFKLADAGISYRLSSECQRIWRMPRKRFADYLARAEQPDDDGNLTEISKAGLLAEAAMSDEGIDSDEKPIIVSEDTFDGSNAVIGEFRVVGLSSELLESSEDSPYLAPDDPRATEWDVKQYSELHGTLCWLGVADELFSDRAKAEAECARLTEAAATPIVLEKKQSKKHPPNRPRTKTKTKDKPVEESPETEPEPGGRGYIEVCEPEGSGSESSTRHKWTIDVHDGSGSWGTVGAFLTEATAAKHAEKIKAMPIEERLNAKYEEEYYLDENDDDLMAYLITLPSDDVAKAIIGLDHDGCLADALFETLVISPARIKQEDIREYMINFMLGDPITPADLVAAIEATMDNAFALEEQIEKLKARIAELEKQSTTSDNPCGP